MTGFRYIQAADITFWLERRYVAPSILPVLIRKLVLATSSNDVRPDFPGDKGVSSPGWDGHIPKAPAGLRFVPEGESVWELSGDRQVFSKANEDFAKRSKFPGSIDPAKVTFVAVSAREWRTKKRDKMAWAKKQKITGLWGDVLALDVHDLVVWLESAPQVAIWFGQEIGLNYPLSVRDLPRAATRFLHQGPPPPIKLADLLVKRDHERDLVHGWLRQTPPGGPLIIEASSPEEATAFFTACVTALPASEQETVECRALVVFNDDDFLTVAESNRQAGLILVAQYTGALAHARYAMGDAGHRVVLPIAQGDNVADCTRVKLGPVAQEVFTKTLTERGLDEKQIHELEISTQRDLTVVTRKLHGAAAPWLSAISQRALFTLMLTRTWRDTQKGDQEYIAALSGTPYDDFVGQLAEWHGRADSPVRKFGDVWKVVAVDEIIKGVGSQVTQPIAALWRKLVTEVFSTQNPKFDLKADDRFAAGIKGKDPMHSPELRNGLASALASLAVTPPPSWLASISPGELVDIVVGDILRWADHWKKWASLQDKLPLLAEASPDMFLSALQDTLDRQAAALTDLFDEDSNWGGSPWVGLVWALEQFAWHPDYFPRAMGLLAQLAELDPGGKNGPRPAGAIERVLCFWKPQTKASVESRQSFIRIMCARYPKAAWQILRALMPSAQGVTSDITHPEWRQWHKGASDSVTEGEYWTMTLFAVEQLLHLAGRDEEKLSELLSIMLDMPADKLGAFLDELSKIAQGAHPGKGKTVIWAQLRQLLHDNRKFPDADWAVRPEIVARLEDLYRAFEPEEIVDRLAWLFAQHPPLPSGGSSDWDQESKQVAVARANAIDELLNAGVVASLLRCVEAADSPWAFGHAFAHHPRAGKHEAAFLGAALRGKTSNLLLAAHGYIFVRSHADDAEQWVKANLPKGGKELLNFVTGLPFGPVAWDLAAKTPALEQAYWKAISPDRITDDVPALERAVRSLLRFGRPMAALAVAGGQVRDGRSALLSNAVLLEVMEHVLRSDGKNPADPINRTMLGHWLREILGVLGKATDIDIRRVGILEFGLIDVFLHERGSGPLVLQRTLNEEPEFFAQLVANTFRAKGEPAKKNVPKDKAKLAERSYRVLKEWRSLPGQSQDGSIDADKLKAWIVRARKLAKEQKRVEVADSLIGEMLARVPQGKDGNWPCEEVRPVIEDHTTEKIRNGIRIGLFNKRGGGFRARPAGGSPEREIAAAHRAQSDALKQDWPIIAALQRAMADNYEWYAKRYDREAEEEENTR